MSVNIKRTEDRAIYVNDKLVTLDKDGDWIAPFDELTTAESKALHEYLQSEQLSMKNRLN